MIITNGQRRFGIVQMYSNFKLFICPECGCKNDKIRGYEFFAKNLKTLDPWFEEFEFINCPKCIRSIPGSLGYRYGKTKTYDKAKKME